jgi:hypothetical protein
MKKHEYMIYEGKSNNHSISILPNKTFRKLLQSQQYISHDYKSPNIQSNHLSCFTKISDIKNDIFSSDLKTQYVNKLEIQSRLIAPSIHLRK